MTKKMKDLADKCNFINEAKILRNELKISRRNGYYAVDRYTEGIYVGYSFCGTWKEVNCYLQGILTTIYFSK